MSKETRNGGKLRGSCFRGGRLCILRLLFSAVFAAGLLLGGCSFAKAGQETWSVYLYLCGSNLETDNGFATANLDALRGVKLPENVRFIIQTGGAEEWHTKGIPGNALGRYVCDHTGFREIERLEDASMGDEKTLEDFLRFGKEKFPADRRMLILWDHGGGSLGGFCMDEKYGTVLGLKDLRRALEAAYGQSPESPPFDLVMFDTCLMASIETANTLHGFARYLAASEETMPGTGTDYAGWVGALARDPSMDGKALGTVVCETYLPYCKAHESGDMATLSLIDLGKLPALNAAYEEVGREALREARRDPQHFFTALDRVANGVESYGTNSDGEWTNMVDLGSLSENVEGLASAPALTRAIQEAVVCRVAGPYRKYGMGLSGYYSLDGSLATWLDYDSLPGASPAMSKLYQDMLSGSGDGVPWFHFDKARIANTPVTFDRDNVATVTLSPEDVNSISSASFILCSYDEKGNRIYLGRDEKMEADWEKGVFRENFDGMWPAINGHFILLQVDEQQKDYSLYISEILVNGKKCYMTAAYDYTKEAFEILSIRRILKNGWLDRQEVQLKPGDRITPLFMDEEGKDVKGETFVLEAAPVLRDEPLPDGTYAFAFRFATARQEAAASETVHFEIQKGELMAVRE